MFAETVVCTRRDFIVQASEMSSKGLKISGCVRFLGRPLFNFFFNDMSGYDQSWMDHSALTVIGVLFLSAAEPLHHTAAS